MDLPDQDVAIDWEGAAVVDRAGVQLGRCTGVFADVDTDAVEWITVAVEEHGRLFIPALGATESGGTVRVGFASGDVLAAPHVGDVQELSKADEVRLYEHYGVAHTSAASGSVLPIGVATPSSGTSSADQLPPAPEVALTPAVEPPAEVKTPTTAAVETPLDLPVQLDEVPAPAPTAALPTPPPMDPVAEMNDPVPVIHLPEPAPTTEAPVRPSFEAGQAPAPPILSSAPKPPPSVGSTSASTATPLAVVAGVVAVAGIVLQVWELRARRRRRPAARAGRAGKQARATSTSAVRTAARQLTDVNVAAARTTRQLADAASTAAESAAHSGSAVTSSVAAIPPAIARRRSSHSPTRSRANP